MMNRAKTIELKGIYIGIGFITGLIISLLVYSLLILSLKSGLSFSIIARIHSENPLIILIDVLPFAGMIAGYFLVRSRISLLKTIEETQKTDDEKSDYIREIVKNLTIGNLSAKIKEDRLNSSIAEQLKELQARLKENLQTQKTTRQADQQRNWTSHGLAEFGDILRTYSSNLEALAYQVISNLVRYLDVNQGGFFIIQQENNNRVLEMIASHAYDRKKFPDKKLSWGEGLIGAVAIEKKSYYTNKIPDGYLTITSGLGRANPRYLLIVPLVLNDEVFGVFELASFNEIRDFEIQFVERVAENTATTINILKNNLRTEQLLKETQLQASKLAEQEEKVRQNIEELKATQAEAALQSEQFISFTNTVNHTLIRAEYNTDGKLIYANTRFLKKLGYSGNREVDGKDISQFIHPNDREWFMEIWDRLSHGGVHYEGYMRHVTKMGMDLWTMATYTCVRKDDGSIEKVLFLSIESKSQKKKNLDFEGQINAINKLNPKAEFSPDGHLLQSNELFLKTFKYSSKELENKNIFDFFSRSEQERFNEIWEKVALGNAFQGQLRMLGKFEEEIWLRTTFNTIDDLYGEVDKIIFIAYDISREKELEIAMREQNEMLKQGEDKMKIQSLDLRKQLDELNSLRKSESDQLQLEIRRQSEILDKHPLPILAINNQGIVILFNKAAAKLWKTAQKNAINKFADILFHPEQKHPVIQALTDPKKAVSELKYEALTLVLADNSELQKTVSLFETESGSELIYTLLIHG